jgi:hypothetical protein
LPGQQSRAGIRRLNLLRKAGVIEAHQHFMSLIGRSPHSVANDDDMVAEVEHLKRGWKQAYVVQQSLARFVDDLGRGLGADDKGKVIFQEW